MAENGRKITNFLVVHGGRHRRFAGLIPARPAAVRHEIPRGDRLDVVHLLGWRVSPMADRWCLVWSDPSWLADEQKTQLGSWFGELFPRFLRAQKVSWGLEFHLASHLFLYRV